MEALKLARLASQNAHKLTELQAALPGWDVRPLAAVDYPEETGTTYAENAWLKARYGRTLAGAGEWVLAEDSGIECDALGGFPGLHSARWTSAPDQAGALLERLGAAANRGAQMVAELVAVSPAGVEFRGRGVMEGALAFESRGVGGFGYDPIFVPEAETQTVAELGDEWKREHSHRGRAARALLDVVG